MSLWTWLGRVVRLGLREPQRWESFHEPRPRSGAVVFHCWGCGRDFLGEAKFRAHVCRPRGVA